MIVLFRSSEAAVSAGSLGDETKEGLRWNGKHKLEIIRKCYLSIQRSLDKNDKIIITVLSSFGKIYASDVPPLNEA